MHQTRIGLGSRAVYCPFHERLIQLPNYHSELVESLQWLHFSHSSGWQHCLHTVCGDSHIGYCDHQRQVSCVYVCFLCCNSGTVTQTGLLTRADVLRSQAAPALSAEEAIKNVGGTFFSNMLNPWRGRGARSLLGGGAALSGGTAAQAPSESQQQPVAPSAGSAPQQEYQYYIPRDKRKQMETPFEDPRDRALAPHLRGRGILSPERASPESIPMPEDDDMVYDTEDRYVREPRLRDSRTPSERYDAEMPDIPPERVSRRRNMSLDEDSELFDRTPGSHRAPMFR